LVQAPLYQKGHSLTTGDALLEPLSDRVGEVHGLATEVNPGQAMHAFEILDDIVVIGSTADLEDAQKADQFLFGHDGGTGTECTCQAPVGPFWTRTYLFAGPTLTRPAFWLAFRLHSMLYCHSNWLLWHYFEEP
jgi:hypothetical protein